MSYGKVSYVSAFGHVTLQNIATNQMPHSVQFITTKGVE